MRLTKTSSSASLIISMLVLLSLSHQARADWQSAGNHIAAGGRIDACKVDFADIYPWAVASYNLSSSEDSIHLGTLEIVGVRCTWKKKNGGIPDLFSGGDIVCPAGERKNPNRSGGCGDTSYVQQCPSTHQQDSEASGVAGNQAGNPIDLRNGAKIETVTDFSLPGNHEFGLIRTYNSTTTRSSRLGYGWRTNFDRNLISAGSFSSQYIVEIVDGDGASTAFRRTGGVFQLAYWKRSLGQWYYTRNGLNATLVKLANGWEYTTETGRVEFFDTNGALQWTREPDGYQIDFTYDANGNNSQVQDSFGRTITMWYDPQGRMQAAFDPSGKAYDYSYAVIGDDFPATTDPTTAGRNGMLSSVSYPDDTPNDDTDNPTVSYHYEVANAPTALTGITDEAGVRIKTWAYDSNGRGISSEHANGTDRVTISYGNNSATVTNALGKQTIIEFENYQDTLRLTAVNGQASLNCAAANSSYTYDNNGYISSITDAKGRITKFTNDSEGRRSKVEQAFGTADLRTINASWNANLSQPTLISKPGLDTAYTYDNNNRVITITQTDTTSHTLPYVTNGQSRVWNLTWTAQSQIDTIDGPLPGFGDTVDYDYDSAGNLIRFTNEMGQITQIVSHNANGLPLEIIDPNGVSTIFTYSPRGMLSSYTVIDPYGGATTTSLTYTNNGNLSGIIPPNGAWIGLWYDGASRLTTIGNNAGDSIDFTYDDLGNTTSTVFSDSANNIRHRFDKTFDELARVLTNVGANNQTTSYSWDQVNNLISSTDANGGTTNQSYDNLNRLRTQTNAISASIAANYGNNGISTITDPGGLTTAFVRNGWGEIIRESSPDAGITDYELNELGLITKRTDARGQITSYAYDNSGRLTAENFAGNSTQDIDYIWDVGGDRGVGRLTQIWDAEGVTDLIYDARGELYKEIRIQNNQNYEIIYADDGTGEITGMTYPSGRIVSFVRDTAGRVTDVQTRDNSGSPLQSILSDINYLPFGPLTSGTFGNGHGLLVSYDLDYQIKTIKTGGGSIVDLNFSQDPNGNITGLINGTDPTRTQSFSYDPANRLISASGVYGSMGYSYDLTGNRLSRTINSGSTITENYNYANGSNLLTSVTGNGGRTLVWNAAGQVSTDTKGSDTYFYNQDAEGRTQTVIRNGSTIASYGYDAFSRRVTKTLTGQLIHYIYDRDDHLIAEHNGNTGAVIREYIWLGLTPLAVIDYTLGNPVLNFLHSDHLGRPIAATDIAGTQVWDGAFTPFGESVLLAGSLSLELRFPGQIRDSETELYYNFTRIYDPSIGRYLQYDTIGLNGGINPFAYVGGNPVGFVDPRGEALQVVGALAFGGLDLFVQLRNNGNRWQCVNWAQVGISAAFGAVGGGILGGSLMRSLNGARFTAGSMKTDTAIKRFRRAKGIFGRDTEVHHAIFRNANKSVPRSIRNHPANLKPLPQTTHRRLHGRWQGKSKLGLPQRIWQGSPDWAQLAGSLPLAGGAMDALQALGLGQEKCKQGCN